MILSKAEKMKIGIISDSHDHHVNVLKAVEIFKNENVQYILHAGDIVSPFTAKAFSAVSGARFIAVFGNNDGEKHLLKTVIESFCRKASPSGGGEIHRDPYHGQIAGKKILITHKPSILDEAIASGKYDIIVYGHTHSKDIRTVGKTLIINPGEATDWLSGKGSLVILDTENLKTKEMEL
jgi:putative phosphoesterase